MAILQMYKRNFTVILPSAIGIAFPLFLLDDVPDPLENFTFIRSYIGSSVIFCFFISIIFSWWMFDELPTLKMRSSLYYLFCSIFISLIPAFFYTITLPLSAYPAPIAEMSVRGLISGLFLGFLAIRVIPLAHKHLDGS